MLGSFDRWFGVAALGLTAGFVPDLSAQATAGGSPVPFTVEVTGRNRLGAMILIPGLTNDGSVWKATVDEFGEDYEMHVLSLAGFAGQPPVATDSGWLERIRDEIVKYAGAEQIEKPVLVGHSLGGFLSLWIAATTPELPSAVINVDGLPFLAAAGNSSATVESVRPQAVQMRQMMTAPGGQFAQMQEQQIRMMVRDTAALPAVLEMARESDIATVSTAMYELFTTDLRPELARVTAPVLNLHAWAAYKSYGSTRATVEQMLAAQYAKLPNATTRIHDESYHFIMYDEPEWMVSEIRSFLRGVTR
jgi:pimeloyl-ACP methyl ester carboxylesterase